MHSTVMSWLQRGAAMFHTGALGGRMHQVSLVFCVIAGLAAGNAEAQTAPSTTKPKPAAGAKPGAKPGTKPAAGTAKTKTTKTTKGKTAKKPGQMTPPAAIPPATTDSGSSSTATEGLTTDDPTVPSSEAPYASPDSGSTAPAVASPPPAEIAPEPAATPPAPTPTPPAEPATATPTPAPSSGVAQPASGSSSNVPQTSPFVGPDPGRTMPPPSGLAGIDMPDPTAGPDSIESSVEQLLSEAVVTTASKRNQRIKDVPLTVSWIPGEELEGTGAFTLCEAVQYFPGMECRRGSMRKAAVSARGLGSNYLSNRLLLLKDGRPLTDPWTGQFYADETTPLTNLKQVEVIRGPGSSLYGSNAFSGVINLIERQPSDLMKEKENFAVEGRVLAGQDETYRLQTTAAGRGGPVEALVTYYGFSSKGPELFSDPLVGRVDDNQDSLVHQVSGKVKVKNFSLDADYTNAEIGRPGGTQISTVGNCGRCHYTPNDVEKVENLNAAAQMDMQVTDNLRVFGQGYAYFKRRVVDQRNMITDELQPALGKRRRFGGEARALLTVGDLSVTFGGDVKNDLVNNQNVLSELLLDEAGELQTKQTIIGGFVDAEYRPMSKLVIGAGARYDRYAIPENVWRQRTDQISPRASIVFHALDDLTLRTNYGRAFRAPTLAELAINQQMYAATLLGNPDLRAETLDTFEAAVDFWPFERRVRLTATGFYNLANNFINQELSFGSTSQFKNIGDARVMGVEAEAAAQIPSVNSSFHLAYQFLDAQALPYDGGDSSQLDYAPHHRVYARARTNIGKVAFAEVYAVYVGERFDPGFLVDSSGAVERVKLPDYVTASARVGVNINDRVAVSLLGTNLFDSNYEEAHGFPAPPRGLYTEVKFHY
jgi:outer membrane receptor protein involved in Fe transport